MGGLETERVDNVVDLLGAVLESLLLLLSGGIGTDICADERNRVSDAGPSCAFDCSNGFTAMPGVHG